MSVAFDIAAAVAAELNTGFAGEFTATLTALPGAGIDDLETSRVSVVPRAVQPAQATRTRRGLDVTVDIGIQRKVGADLESDVPALAGLAQRVLDFLWRRPLAAAPTAVFLDAVNEPVFAPEHLEQLRVFTSVVTVSYRT
ncbi:MAG: hypothetical protein BWZ02_02078 [Lentisphaerae bacterium ADurb.BinA184]|nr:MAG: hypothetical protein BWZ02_02078 [Lentisphaerae bacterium ADurb.BinA184]